MAYFLKTDTARGKKPQFWRGSNGNSGAIVGTATYSGSNTNIASGSHGVVLAPAYEIQVDAYIPQEWVSNPANSAIQTMLGAFWSLIGSPELVYYGGDQRKSPLDASFNTGTATFQKSLSYRVRQKVMATALKEYDPDGSQEQEESGEAQNSIVGTTTLYLGYQLSGGHIAAGQSPLMTGHASPTSPTVTVTHPSSRVVNAEFIMQASNPLAPGSSVGPIYYDLTVSIDASNPSAPTYTLTGNHKLFPAYEVYVNQQLIHDYSPIPGNHQPSDLVILPGASVPSVSDTSVTAGTTKPLTGNITP